MSQGDTVTGYDWRYLVLSIAEERSITDRRLARRRELPARVRDPFVTVVPKEQRPNPMQCGKDDHE